MLRRAVDGGFFSLWFLTRDPWLDPLRAEPGFDAIVQAATAHHRAARETFVQAEGDRVLGLVRGSSSADD